MHQCPPPCGRTSSQSPCETRISFLNFSYACPEPVLANIRVLVAIKWRTEKRFSPHQVLWQSPPVSIFRIWYAQPSCGVNSMSRISLRKAHLCFELFLCLPRACLGKSIDFCIKMGNKTFRTSGSAVGSHRAGGCWRRRTARRSRPRRAAAAVGSL